MMVNAVYYNVKPFLPLFVRRALRRRLVARKLASCGDVWPINQAAAKIPEGWPGWPAGKRFALVLTHDVESQAGLDRCRQLMELEMQFGFRSSFNFVPEGSYRVPPDLRADLVKNGFEIGIHDLKHDGKLYRSRKVFRKSAQRINEYLKEWNATGFRSAFMLHNLEWIHDLNILYDASTFDTDPFEPQPDGVETIFPFWVPAPGASPASGLNRERGYVELPYTLPQDSTLFLHMEQPGIEVWKRKLNWIVAHGGMAMVIVHPDYMAIDNRCGSGEFPSAFYQEFLRHLKSEYQDQYWLALPGEVAEFARKHKEVLRHHPVWSKAPADREHPARGRKIWIDLENTPHIPFFKPIIRELEKRDHQVVLTARDAFQTCEMADRFGFEYRRIGRHYGQNPVLKVLGLMVRAFQLLPFALRERPDLAVNHGARAQILICNLLRIPTVLIMDYEHTSTPPLVRPRWEIVPAIVSDEGLHCRRKEKIRKYTGIKEDVYVPDFKPDSSVISQLQLNGGAIVVTVRPPATEAHYHNPESEVLFSHFMNRVRESPCVKAVLLPRNKKQEAAIKAKWPEWFADSKVVIPGQVVDGLNLLWHSDLVVSGGGTMNREAAALGVPVYSIFRGVIGAVDRQLQEEGRLILIESTEDVDSKILLEPRDRNPLPDSRPREALQNIVEHLVSILGIHYPD
jgi:uncharacterized protein